MSIAKLKAIRRESGVPGMLLLGLRRVLQPVMVFGSLVFFECDLRSPFPLAPPDNGFSAREGFESDLDLLQALDGGGEYRQTALARLRNGERWFIGVESSTGQLANYRWMTDQPAFVPEIGRYLMLKPGEVYIYDLFTVPRYRRHGVDAYVRHSVYSSLASAGLVKIHAYIRGSNYPSLRAARLLLTETGRLWYVTVFGRSFTFAWPRARMIELRGNSGSVPGTMPAKSRH